MVCACRGCSVCVLVRFSPLALETCYWRVSRSISEREHKRVAMDLCNLL